MAQVHAASVAVICILDNLVGINHAIFPRVQVGKSMCRVKGALARRPREKGPCVIKSYILFSIPHVTR